MSTKTDGNKNPKSAKVLKLGFNISVSGDPDTDFEIVLDDKEQKTVNSSSKNEDSRGLDPIKYPTMDMPNQELEKIKTEEVIHSQTTGAIPKHRKSAESSHSSESPQISESEKTENSIPKDSSIIDQIKSTMEHFEKFSDHIKEIPRLRNHPVATSTPLVDKYNSKSESNLTYSEYRPRKFSHRYDFYSRKEYFKSSVRPVAQDLFLKPLPAEGYYKRGIYSRYLDLEPYRHFGSDNSLNKSSDYKSICAKSNSSLDKLDECNYQSETHGILKKSDSENGDKQSTSSADSIKDIKIYQSGGILIMQNFKDNLDFAEKKEMSEFSAKLIENCNKLKMEVSGFQDDIPAIGTSSDENKNLGKMVQFDLSSFDGQKSKSGDSSSNAARDEFSVRMESSESTSDCVKNKDSSPQGTSQSQDFPSLSTQENDSIISNQPGMSPSYSSSKKLEWDSGADVGYLNLDLTKENLSTIEKIVLKGLSSDGRSEKNVVYEKQPEQNQTNRSKFILSRLPSDLVIEGESNGAANPKNVSEGSKGDSGKVSQDGTEEDVISKGETRSKFEEIKSSSNESSGRKTSTIKPAEKQPKSSETTDKSVNVNTLFDDVDFQTPLCQSIARELIRSVESPKKPKFKKSPKIKTSKSKSRLLRAPKKVTPPPATPSFAMGGSKKVFKKVEAAPALSDVELSREVEEIIIDQRFKIKQSVQPGQAATEILCKDNVDSVKEVKTKGRPISASSVASNSTVLRKFEEKTKTQSKLNDQIIQTSDCDCESVGIQAFSSQKSSDFDFRSFTKNSKKPSERVKESINTSSKNIQAFGLNSSLPKQLEHPKETELINNHHTKSTQFFGGPLNSLPNYHSNLITKPGESCGRMPNILKTKKNFEAEVIRLKEENEKNILANDTPSEPKTESKKLSNNENKENLITKKSSNSKSQSRTSKGNGTASQDSDVKVSEEKAKKKSPSVECSDCPHTSDEVSSMILTSEVLKVHGDSIDRNIIKEKYFQSQLDELEKRKMISRSTSMEIQLQMEDEATGKEFTTTGCQYSPQSRATTSGGHYQEPEDDSSKENPNEKTHTSSLEQFGSSHNVEEERFVIEKSARMGAGDSLPSSTQTAHSWLAGVQNARVDSNGVGRARSFEYLPGHVYESSGNLREELPSETEQNLITSTSQSDTAKSSARGSARDSQRGSEGRNTLILENSSESSQNSNQMKILDDNLSRLSSALLKFWEKDAQVQNITQSLFMNFWRKNGSGDWLLSAGPDLSKTEGGDCEGGKNSGEKRNDTLSGSCEQERKQCRRREFSIACQTEGKLPSPDTEKIYEDRKALEKRISEEKKSQIKWIENEIHHLNILRKLLEKQGGSVQRKKKQSHESNELSKNEDRESVYTDTHSGPVTPVFGCTVILDDENPQERVPSFPEGHIDSEILDLGPRPTIQREPPFRRGSSRQNAQSLGQPSNEQYAQPLGQPSNEQYAQPLGQPSNEQYAQPLGQPSNEQYAQPLGQPPNEQYAQPLRQPPNEQYAQPFGRGSNGQYTQSLGQPPNEQYVLPSGQVPTDQYAQPLGQPVSEQYAPSFGQVHSQEYAQSLGQVSSEQYTPPLKPVFSEQHIQPLTEEYDTLSVGIQVSLKDCNSEDDVRINYESVNANSGLDPRRQNMRAYEPIPEAKLYQSEVNTQFPSPRRTSGSIHLASIRSDFDSGNCAACGKDNCFCLNFSEKSYPSVSHTNKSRRVFCCQSKGPSFDHDNKTSNSTDPEFRVIESAPCQPGQNDRSDFPEISAKVKSVQGTNCKCLNCPKRMASVLNKIGMICRSKCQSNVHLNCEKISDDCRCSKVQIQKSSNCHIIKIHGPNCCSTERQRRINPIKKTENQYCQTDPCLTKESKPTVSDSRKQERVTPDYVSRRREPIDPNLRAKTSEADISTSSIIVTEGKGKHQSTETDISTSSSRATEGKEKQQSPEPDVSTFESRAAETNVKSKKSAVTCSCRKKEEMERAKVDEHPRHYFLRIEEAEVEDESMEQKKSLEVITVTVPVRKAGKGKIYDNDNIRQAVDDQKPDSAPTGCNCCAACIDHSRKQPPEPSIQTNYRREAFVATRTPSKQTQNIENFFDESTTYPSIAPTRQEYHQDRNNRYSPVESSSFGGRANDHPEPDCCESCSCLNRNGESSKNYQNDRNGRKNRTGESSNEYYEDELPKFYDHGRTDRRPAIVTERDRGLEVRQRGQDLNPEYYNYNKREFMTKSEIAKEEKQKRKVRQLPLQEYLTTNRPDFYSNAERRRHIISERAQDRVKQHKSRMDCLMSMMKHCTESNPPEPGGSKRIFTTVQMREQTMKRYKNLPEVTGKMADQKKKDEYRTNRLMAEIFAKKLQIEALKGHINLSNSVSVLYTI